MKQRIDLATWHRREHFEFFSSFEEPFFGVTVDVDATQTYAHAKAGGPTFSTRYLHAIMQVANSIENLRYRIEDGEVYCYEVVHAAPTLLRPNQTFGFAVVPYSPDVATFAASVAERQAHVNQQPGLALGPDSTRADVIHFSALPWLSFTSISHARSFSYRDAIPKISVGKARREGAKLLLPVSLHVHHGLADGYHVGQFFEALQATLQAPAASMAT